MVRTTHSMKINITEKKLWYVYIVRCSDGTLYTGISNNVEARVGKHNSGKGAKYTRARRPVELMWSESAGTRSDAAKREYQIKRMPREKKIMLFSMSSLL